MDILFVKASNVEDVRLQKYLKTAKKIAGKIVFCGWERKLVNDDSFEKVETVYLLGQAPSSKATLSLYYLVWLVKSFLYILANKSKYEKIYCADFEAALPCYLANFFGKKVEYIYDVYDEFSLRYRLPNKAVKLLNKLEQSIRKNASLVVHVHEMRRSILDSNNVVIVENSPLDYFSSGYVIPDFKRSIAVTGYLTSKRGVLSILSFVESNPDIEFIIAGRFDSDNTKASFLRCNNVKFLGFVSQHSLFEEISNCSAIFSLYDPSVAINRLAASNKLYDAMMLGIPVITNDGIKAAEFVLGESIGLVVNYELDESWQQIIDVINNLDKIREFSVQGRKLFESNYNFEKMVSGVI